LSHGLLPTGCACELLEETAVLLEVTVAEELAGHALMAVLGQPPGLVAVSDERLDCAAERRQVGRIVDEQARPKPQMGRGEPRRWEGLKIGWPSGRAGSSPSPGIAQPS
jgi:hypothetical protein